MARGQRLNRGGWPPEPGGRPGESGAILVLTLVVLLVISMLAGASLITGMLQRSQTRSEANAALALHAAEGGAAAGMAWLSDPDNIDKYVYPNLSGDVPDPTVIDDAATPTVNEAYTTKTDWQRWSRTLSGEFPGGGSHVRVPVRARYETIIRFKRERRDRNGDGDCCDTYPDAPLDENSEYSDGDTNPCTTCPGEVVLFNAGTGNGGFGFSAAHYTGALGDEGYPIVEIESVGTYGSAAVREIALFVARNHKAQIEGAFTTRTPVDKLNLNKEIDGRNAGTTCGVDLPGVVFDVGLALPCDLNSDGDCADAGECGEIAKVSGSTCAESFDPNQPGKRPLAKTPWDVLGMTEVDFRSLFIPKDADTLDTKTCNNPNQPVNFWFTNDLVNAAPKEGCNGILVVHNPRFDPDKWDPGSPGYDAVYASNPDNKPAKFAITGSGNVEWNGIVIADQVGMVNGNLSINGGLYSLASGGDGVVTDLQGSFSVTYNCDLVNAFTKRIGYKKKIGWQRIR